jgi:hypothetical protein
VIGLFFMRFIPKCFGAIFIMVLGVSIASAQPALKRAVALDAASSATDQPEVNQTIATAPTVTIHLVDGRQMQVDDVTKVADGIWYTRGSVTSFLDSATVLRIERSEPARKDVPAAVVAGSGRWKISDSTKVEDFFMSRFKRPLPLTAFGQSELHNRWGLDHRNSMDVGLHPDSVEGKVLIKFLVSEQIPFLAFRTSVPGVATGPHIHVGNGSHRMIRQ